MSEGAKSVLWTWPQPDEKNIMKRIKIFFSIFLKLHSGIVLFYQIIFLNDSFLTGQSVYLIYYTPFLLNITNQI